MYTYIPSLLDLPPTHLGYLRAPSGAPCAVQQLPIVQFSSISQSCPMECNMPSLPVHHQLPQFAQTHAHWVGDAIQPSHPLQPPSPPIFNLSQHQGVFQRVSSSHQVAKILEFQLSISPSNEYSGLISLGWTSWISLLSKGLSTSH